MNFCFQDQLERASVFRGRSEFSAKGSVIVPNRRTAQPQYDHNDKTLSRITLGGPENIILCEIIRK